jgi:dTMP kinase
MRGLFIVFEGITGSGKKTHIKLLTEKLQNLGRDVTVISFPDFESEIARLTKRADLDNFTVSLLYAADRSRHQERIKSILEKGGVVITDRYCYSNFAFQSAKGVPLNWLMQIEKNIIKPDLVFLIDAPIEVSMKRVQQANIEDFTKRDILDRIQRERKNLEMTRENFLLLSRRDLESKWFVIDGSLNIEKIHQLVWEVVSKELGK